MLRGKLLLFSIFVVVQVQCHKSADYVEFAHAHTQSHTPQNSSDVHLQEVPNNTHRHDTDTGIEEFDKNRCVGSEWREWLDIRWGGRDAVGIGIDIAILGLKWSQEAQDNRVGTEME